MDNAKLQQKRELYSFSGFRLDTAERRLWFEDEPISLKPKQFDLLHFFVQNAGRAITKNELLEAVWADTFVEETTLARNVSWLRTTLGKYTDGDAIIETVPKLGYRFTPEVTHIEPADEILIVEKQTVQYVRAEETLTIDDQPDEVENKVAYPPKNAVLPLQRQRRSWSSFFLYASILLAIVLAGSGFLYWNKNQPNGSKNSARLNRVPSKDRQQIKIGSIVNLQNRYPNDGSYLDAWGAVWSKPEFNQVSTETMFVSTHYKPDRETGSGSWQIVSAVGKSEGEPLVVGDRVHLKNMYPNAGYLDACGWLEHLPVFKNYSDHAGAIFTTKSADRDNGTGVWIIRSAAEESGTPLLEGDSIAIESSFFINDGGLSRITGFLDVTGNVRDIPAFSDHDGVKLVFTKNVPHNQPIPDIWTITLSRAKFE